MPPSNTAIRLPPGPRESQWPLGKSPPNQAFAGTCDERQYFEKYKGQTARYEGESKDQTFMLQSDCL